MKKITTIAKAVLTIIIFMAAIRQSTAATFTAVANGNWTSNATWGLSGPGVNITGADVVVIPAGITVTLDADVTVNHSLALISVLGTLSGSHNLTITSGDLTQSGSIAVNALTIGTTGYLTSTGTIAVNNFTNMQAALALTSDVTVNGMLMLSAGAIQLNTGSSIQLGNNATVHISGGSMSINGGAVNVVGNYNLTYSGSASSIGMEASLPGLQNVTINLSAPSANIQLQGDLTVSGQLDLQQGTLVLSGNDLTINGTISTSANASVSATAASNITISGSGAVGTLAFSTTANTVGNLTVNTSGGNGSISLGSDVTVTGALTLQAGTLNLSGNDLTLSGTIDASGSGSISSSASSNITITGSSSVGTIDFTTGSSVVGNLTINITGLDGSVSLGTDVTVNGTLTISAGTLALNGFNLTTGGAIQISGNGAIGGHVSSDVTINGSGSIGTIVFTGSGSTIHDLTINVSGGGSVSLGTDVTIAGALTLQSGTFTLNGNDLTLSGTVDASGSGSISSSASSDITITGSGTLGTIEFSTGSSVVGNLTINISGLNGSVSLGSDVTVSGTLTISAGTLALNGFNLTTGGAIQISSNGAIGGHVSSDVTINGSGSIGTIVFTGSGSTIHDLTINISGGGSVSLGTDVTIAGALTLQSGTFTLNGNDLTLSGTIDASGSGSISSSASSDITITGSGTVGTIEFSTGSSVVGNLTINISGLNGSVSLGSDVTVSGTLTISAGTLALNGFNLTTGGAIQISGNGAIGGHVSSDVTINGSGSIGTIVFTGSGSTIHDLTINIGGGGSVSLGTDVTIAGALTLQSGTFTLNGNDLTLSGTIDASGSGSISSSASSDITITGSGTVGTIEFSAGGQTVGDFTVNLAGQWGTVSLGSDMTVAGELSLATGNIALGSFDLTIGSSGSIQGGSAGGYIDASGSGSLIMSLGASGGSATFQVGTSTGYAPVIITNNSATAGQFMVSTNAGVFANGSSGADISATESVVNVSWDIETDISANVNAQVEAFWTQAMEVNAFNRAQAYVSHYVNGAWDVSAAAQATAHLDGTFSVTRNNITSFSPFAVFDNNTATGIEHLAAAPALSIFPNPAGQVMNVSVSEVGGNYRIRIYDATGRIMAENLITSTNTAFDISAWERGVYFVSVNNGRAITFVKQ